MPGSDQGSRWTRLRRSSQVAAVPELFISTKNLVWQSILAILAEDYFLLSGERNDNFL